MESDEYEVRTLRGGGNSIRSKCVHGGRWGQKSMNIERMCFVNGSLQQSMKFPLDPFDIKKNMHINWQAYCANVYS